MKQNSDALIDRALSALDNAQPPAGMAQRILAHAESRGTSKSRSIRAGSFFYLFGSQRTWQTAMAGVAVSACVGAFVFTHVHRSPQGIANADHKRLAKQSEIATRQEFLAPGIVPAIHTVVQRRGKISSPQPAQNADAQSIVDDMHAPSQPAPELPLTKQEKLLLRVAYHHDPVLMAELNQTDLAIMLDKEHAEVEKFFEHTPLPETASENQTLDTASPADKTSTAEETPAQPTEEATIPTTGDSK